jgi:hypothetical protein
MANTERLKAIQLVHVALLAALDAEADETLDTRQRDRAETAALQLRTVEGRLIMDEMDELVADLKNDVVPLRTLVTQMKKDVAKLQGVAQKIDVAARAIGALVEIASKAASSGLA